MSTTGMLPTAGGRLFFTGVAFAGSAVRVGFLRPLTGSFQPVSGLDTNRRDEGASFFVPFSQGRKVMVAGGGVATTALGDFTLTPVTTPTGLRWSLTSNSNLTPPGSYYLVAVDARDVPSKAKIIKLT